MKTLIMILLTVFVTVNGVSDVIITEENIQEYISADCESVANYIVDNLQLFAQEYNNQLDNESLIFEASYCELMLPVYVVSTEQEGIYLDFDGDNGYMVVVDDYLVLAFETSGDLEYLKDVEYTYYSIYDGFLYLDESGEYLPFDFCAMSESDWGEYSAIEMEQSYAGQDPYVSGSDGGIIDPDAYVKDRYGSGYVVKSGDNKELRNYEYVDQYDLSIYYYLNELKYSEGNCSLSSIYSLLNYFQSSGKCPNLPKSSSKTFFYATADPFYIKYAYDECCYDIELPKRLPNLYLAVRDYMIRNCGYEVSGTNPFDISPAIKNVAKQYGYNLTAKDVVMWTYESQVVAEINAGYPTIWNMANSSTYGSHTTVVTGYRTYTKTTNILGINFYSYVKLMLLNDNWAKVGRYFDFTNYIGFGSFVQVR